ncbi:hypothetical protein B0H13DRAFT_1871521 [Mycena leptocephala]|nr:hypothetical protein B0H13DRAFT_1871521 [Mycena leptocephala]
MNAGRRAGNVLGCSGDRACAREQARRGGGKKRVMPQIRLRAKEGEWGDAERRREIGAFMSQSAAIMGDNGVEGRSSGGRGVERNERECDANKCKQMSILGKAERLRTDLEMRGARARQQSCESRVRQRHLGQRKAWHSSSPSPGPSKALCRARLGLTKPGPGLARLAGLGRALNITSHDFEEMFLFMDNHDWTQFPFFWG